MNKCRVYIKKFKNKEGKIGLNVVSAFYIVIAIIIYLISVIYIGLLGEKVNENIVYTFIPLLIGVIMVATFNFISFNRGMTDINEKIKKDLLYKYKLKEENLDSFLYEQYRNHMPNLLMIISVIPAFIYLIFSDFVSTLVTFIVIIILFVILLLYYLIKLINKILLVITESK